MDLSSITSAVVRRWRVVVPVLAITAGAVVWIILSPDTRYEAIATLLLATPRIAGTGAEAPADDPEIRLDPSVVIEIVEGDATRAQLQPEVGTADYTVVQVGEGILRVEATAGSAEPVVAATIAVIDEIERVVSELDAGDQERTADLTVLSRPRVARERTLSDVGDEAETEYFAVGSALLILEEVVAQSQPNPFTASEGTLRVIQEVASVDSVRESIREVVGDDDADFEVFFQSRDAAPILHVVASGSTAETTMATLGAALGFLDADLAERQAVTGSDESTWLVFQRLAVSEEASAAEGSLRRPIATIIVLGLLAATSLAVMVDSLMPRYLSVKFGRGTSRGGTDEFSTVKERRSQSP